MTGTQKIRGVISSKAPLLCVIVGLASLASAETYRGITVAPERRCAPYDRSEYPYPQSIEQRIVASIGAIYGPYSGTCFATTRQTDIEHIVATSEAHDSGLCAAGARVKAAFATDLLNLTLASPTVNRYRKSAKDLAEWTPNLNSCWYAARTLEVRRKYSLTIDRREAKAVESILSRCDSTKMVVADCRESLPVVRPTKPSNQDGDSDALARWDDNGNGRITCAEARRHDIAPVYEGHPAYRYMRDGDGDGVVCE